MKSLLSRGNGRSGGSPDSKNVDQASVDNGGSTILENLLKRPREEEAEAEAEAVYAYMTQQEVPPRILASVRSTGWGACLTGS